MPRSRGRRMSVWPRGSERLRALGLALGAALPAAAEAPQRVVSMNLCTDQLALMLAAPGQVISVTWLAHREDLSPMVEAARGLPSNRGTAEDVAMLEPDLVIAGRFTTVATVEMLQRLGIPVVRFQPENSLDDVETNLARMGAVLGREAEAAARIDAFRRDRAALEAHVAAQLGPERAAIYSARGFTSGPASLAGDILRAAGLANIAEELGIGRGGQLALEALILADPDRLVLGRRHPGRSEAQALLDHPVLRAMPAHARGTPMADRDWICGTPHVLAAVTALIAAREDGA